jgi:hypothetical protein
MIVGAAGRVKGKDEFARLAAGAIDGMASFVVG